MKYFNKLIFFICAHITYFFEIQMQKYKTIKTLGDGAFGTVYKAVNTKTGQTVAIKKMKQKYSSWNECIELRQIKSLRKMSNNNIMKLKQVLLVSEQLYMVFQYLEYNIYEVYAKMKEQNRKFTEGQIKSIVYQVVSGLAHMHKIGFFHRDLKPQNLLIYNNVVKVCDLGLARQIRSRPPFTDYVSTRWYRAPELLLRSTCYNSPVDIFAMGCIMAELYTLTPLFPGNNEVDQMNKIIKVLGTPSKSDWPQGYKMAQAKNYYFPTQTGVNISELIPQACPQAIDLLQSMLQYNSRKRPTASEILKHEYFKGVVLPDFNTQQKQKEIIFEEQPNGTKLNTTKEDKNINIFRVTKQKFKQVRKNEADENNPVKLYESIRFSNLIQKKKLNGQQPGKLEDLDNLIKQLEEKQKQKKKKNKVEKLPVLSSMPVFPMKQKILNQQYKLELRQKPDISFFEMNKQLLDDKKVQKYIGQNKSIRKKEEMFSYSFGNDKIKGIKAQIGKFAYSFQPSQSPLIQLPSIKSPIKSTALGYGSLSKPKLSPACSVYKY